jgi:hypothetical protein
VLALLVFGVCGVFGGFGCVRSGLWGASADGGPARDSAGAGEGAVFLDLGGEVDSGVVDPSALPLSSPGALVLYTNSYAIAARGEGYAAVWVEHPPAEHRIRLMLALIDGAGAIARGPEEVVPLEAPPELLRLFAFEDHLLVFLEQEDKDTLETLVVELGAGAVSTTQVGYRGHPDLFAVDRGIALLSVGQVACSEIEAPEHHVHIELFEPWGRPTAEFPRRVVDCAGADQYYPRGVWTGDGVWTGSGALLVWLDYREGSGRAYGAVLDERLELVDPPARRLSGPIHYEHLRLAADGEGRAVVSWVDEERLFALGVSATGEQLWAEAWSPAPGNVIESLNYAVSGGAGRVGWVWETDRDFALPQIAFAEVALGATALPGPDAATVVSDPAFRYFRPRIVRGGTGFGLLFRGNVAGSRRLFFEEVADR